MYFYELQAGDSFKHPGSDLVWTKNEPFTAYGCIKGQNASIYIKPNGPWHYDRVQAMTVVFIGSDNDDPRSTSQGQETLASNEKD